MAKVTEKNYFERLTNTAKQRQPQNIFDENIAYIQQQSALEQEQKARQAQTPPSKEATTFFKKLDVTRKPATVPIITTPSPLFTSFKNIHRNFAPTSSTAPPTAPTTAPLIAPTNAPSTAPSTAPPIAPTKVPTTEPTTQNEWIVPTNNDHYFVLQTIKENGELIHDTKPVGSTLEPLTDKQTMYLISVSDPKNKDKYTIKSRVSGEKSVEALREELNTVLLPARNIQKTNAGLAVVKAQTVLQRAITAFLKQEKQIRTTGAYDTTISSAQSVLDAAMDAKEKTQLLLDILQLKKSNNSVKKSIAVAQQEIEEYDTVLTDYKEKIIELERNKQNTTSFTGAFPIHSDVNPSNEATAFARGIGGKRRTQKKKKDRQRRN